ncbi:MAG TPA: family 43 glycosylhydrolase [Lachnospiraceae bacterium]|nr:family 43 glycosylhydrolase [Lachnospiraceae bacterium]
MSVIAKNPIMRGFYPDPSICAVGEDFYLVTSSFAYFPGLPIMHSRDLAHWEQIGNVLDRVSQLPLTNAGLSQGLYAPTIRYHEGTFYVICTNVSFGGNFVVTATNPAGPWSEPHYIKNAAGIDPSLFFDDDGKVYYVGMRDNPEGLRFYGDTCVWVQELDIENWVLVGEPVYVWDGVLKDIAWVEAPHLYKKDGWYYLMYAEGGTGEHHCEVVCRSKNVFGPYENNFCNPIITHRHLGKEYPIQYVGHADLVETINKEWYMVMLAVRPFEGYTRMGRETFLAKVTWENDWPVVNAGVGRLTDEVEINLAADIPKQITPGCSLYPEVNGKDAITYDFMDMEQIPAEFLFLRNPSSDMYQLKKGSGLVLNANTGTMKDTSNTAYVAVRQMHQSFLLETLLQAENLTEGMTWGLVLMQNNNYQLRAEVKEGILHIVLCENGIDTILGSHNLLSATETVALYIKVDGLKAEAGLVSEGNRIPIVKEICIKSFSIEVAQGFVGCTMGIYASLKDDSNKGAVYVKYLTYEGL